MNARAQDVEISLVEAVQLGAVDENFYAHFFFPKTVRQKSPPFHREMYKALNSYDRYIAFELFRGSAKTTLVRLYASRLIAYKLSKTIVIIGKSQDHARRTVEWLMMQVVYNTVWATTFQLEKGKKWTSEELEIVVGGDHTIRIIALGITGSTRGINVDDYRPDTIIVDDPQDEENSATLEQREKTDDFINGSLRNSLAPASESPHAKLIFLQTLLNTEDSISKCEHDPRWTFLRFGCFDRNGDSSWPERWTTKELLLEKESFVARGKLHLWMREMECKIVSSELSSFKYSNLRFWEMLPPEAETTYFISIDPVPPPSDRELQKGLKGKDYEVIAVIGRYKGNFYLAEYAISQGHAPDWTIAKFFELKAKYSPMKLRVESIAYQRTLKWLLEKAMSQRGEWIQVEDTGTDRRKKSYRIIDVIGSVTAEHKLYVHRSHTEFIEQYTNYPAISYDDVIETVGMGVSCAMKAGGFFDGDFSRILEAEKDIPDLEYEGGCP